MINIEESFRKGARYNQLLLEINSSFVKAHRYKFPGASPKYFLDIVIETQSKLDEADKLRRDYCPSEERMKEEMNTFYKLLERLHLDIESERVKRERELEIPVSE